MQTLPVIDIGDLPDAIYAHVAEQFTLSAQTFIPARDVEGNIRRYAPHLIKEWDDVGLHDAALILVWS